MPTEFEIDYPNRKETLLKDICDNFIGADCWRVSVFDGSDEVLVLYDLYLKDDNSPIRTLLLNDIRFLQSFLENNLKVVCEFFGDHSGGTIMFSLDEKKENLFAFSSNDVVYDGKCLP